MDVQVSALAARADARPRRVERLVLGDDLDPPVGGVVDDLAAAGRDQHGLGHEAEYDVPRELAELRRVVRRRIVLFYGHLLTLRELHLGHRIPVAELS